jgi:hypothetical protein
VAWRYRFSVSKYSGGRLVGIFQVSQVITLYSIGFSGSRR